MSHKSEERKGITGWIEAVGENYRTFHLINVTSDTYAPPASVFFKLRRAFFMVSPMPLRLSAPLLPRRRIERGE